MLSPAGRERREGAAVVRAARAMMKVDVRVDMERILMID